jgi:TRAP-type C4-dicarboxylate transport system substrate-binding protein
MQSKVSILGRRRFARFAASVPFVFGAARSAAAHGAAWTMATEYPASTVSGEGIAFFATRVAEESQGHLTVMPSYDAALGLKSAEIVAAIRDKKLDAGCAFAGALGKIDPLFLLSSLPFVAVRDSDVRRLLDKAHALYVQEFAREKQRLLYATPWPATGLWAKKPIATPADLAGLKLRTYDATGVGVFTAAGAQPVNLSFADAMPRLLDGTVEAVLSSGDGGAGRKLWEYLPHFTEIGYAMPLSFATLATEQYEEQPADLRGCIDRAATAAQAQGWARLDKRIAENYERLRANKVTITTADQIDPALHKMLAAAAATAIATWKRDAGPEAAALIS